MLPNSQANKLTCHRLMDAFLSQRKKTSLLTTKSVARTSSQSLSPDYLRASTGRSGRMHTEWAALQERNTKPGNPALMAVLKKACSLSLSPRRQYLILQGLLGTNKLCEIVQIRSSQGLAVLAYLARCIGAHETHERVSPNTLSPIPLGLASGCITQHPRNYNRGLVLKTKEDSYAS